MPLDVWEGCTSSELLAEWSLPRVDLFSRVGSTNDLAREAADAGAATGSLVLAEEQTAGRGRVGRAWSSPAGLGLYMSIVARPARDAVAAYPLRIGVAVARALDPWTTSSIVQVKWPNDLLLADRKLGGILCETKWDRGSGGAVIVGIGLNLLHGEHDFPSGVRPFAGSLREAGKPVSRFDVATRVVAELRPLIFDGESTSADWVAELTRRDALLDRAIEVFESETGRWMAAGKGAGILADGALLIDTEDGRIAMRSGSVRYV